MTNHTMAKERGQKDKQWCTKHYTENERSSNTNGTGGIMVSVLASSAEERGFAPRSGQTKDYIIGMCCFSAKHSALRRKSKDCLSRNQNNVSEWSDMSTRGLLFGELALLKPNSVYCSRTKRSSSSSHWKLSCSRHDIAEKLLSWS
jgi:hypothetical protein